jgi:hypothetical protein
MIMEVYASPADVEKFKNYEKICVCSSLIPGGRVKLLIDITKVKISNPTNSGLLSIQRYSPSESTGPK